MCNNGAESKSSWLLSPHEILSLHNRHKEPTEKDDFDCDVFEQTFTKISNMKSNKKRFHEKENSCNDKEIEIKNHSLTEYKSIENDKSTHNGSNHDQDEDTSFEKPIDCVSFTHKSKNSTFENGNL